MQFSAFFLAALSMGSAIAGPLAGYQVFDNTCSAFSKAQTVIQQQHAQISHLTGKKPNAGNIVEIQGCLRTVGQSVNGLFEPALALSTLGSTPLPSNQLSYIPQFSKSFLSIFVEIEAIGKIVTSLSKDQIATCQPELQLALAPAISLARPVLAYIDVAAHSHGYAFQGVSQPLRNIQALLKLAVDLNINVDVNVNVGLGIYI